MKAFLMSIVVVTSSVFVSVHSGWDFVPHGIMKNIKFIAESQHPRDYSAQQKFIHKQADAYYKIKHYDNDALPTSIVKSLLKDAKNRHPTDYIAQLQVISKQEKSYIAQNQLEDKRIPNSVLNKIKSEVASTHLGDYSTQFHVVREQGNLGSVLTIEKKHAMNVSEK